MMMCLSEGQLQSYYDGALSGAEMMAATTHLGACRACAAAIRAIEGEMSLVSLALACDAAPAVPTDVLRERLAHAIARDERRQRAPRSNPIYYRLREAALVVFAPAHRAAFAAIVFALMAGIWFTQTSRNTSSNDIASAVLPVQYEIVKPIALQHERDVRDGGEAGIPDAVKEADRGRDALPPVRISQASDRRRSENINEAVASNAPRVVKLLPGEKSYLKAIVALKETIAAQEPTIQPEMRMEYERNLAIVNQAIATSRMAAKHDPRDTDANYQLLSAYQSKVELLSVVAGQTQTSYENR